MKNEDKKTIKEIIKHRDLERNLPLYASAYSDEVYEYSLIHLMLNYYTMKEIEDDTAGVSSDNILSETMERINNALYQTLLSDTWEENREAVLEDIHALRERLTGTMTVLTAYTDSLQLYEYVLNRVEYAITGETYPVEEGALAAKVFAYLFRDNDKMVVNSKIQMVTSQLPIRMTKNRFYDYLTDTLNIYRGSETKSVDDFVDMLKSTALLELPSGYGEDYAEIVDFIETLSGMDIKNLSLVEYQSLMEQFSMTTNRLTELVSNHMIAMEIVNDICAALLVLPYENNAESGTATCLSMLRGLHDAFVSGGGIPELVDDGFMKIEGLQEQLGEEILQFEAILPDVLSEHGDLIERLDLTPVIHNLSATSKLLSGSLFVRLEDEPLSVAADEAYIAGKRDELVGMLSAFFESHNKEINRAVMALLFSNMPVLFNSHEEIKQYIEYSLNHCGSESELMACAKILDDMMAEE